MTATPIPDFGRGSREQTQGGPTPRNENNVHPIHKAADTAATRG